MGQSVLMMGHLRTLCNLLLLAGVIGKEAAEKCNTSKCKLPDCFCSGNETTIEGPTDPSKKPQLVFLTFDDALTATADTQFYSELFGTPTDHKYSNPN